MINHSLILVVGRGRRVVVVEQASIILCHPRCSMFWTFVHGQVWWCSTLNIDVCIRLRCSRPLSCFDILVLGMTLNYRACDSPIGSPFYRKVAPIRLYLQSTLEMFSEWENPIGSTFCRKVDPIRCAYWLLLSIRLPQYAVPIDSSFFNPPTRTIFVCSVLLRRPLHDPE
jgi:hypothetical protein